MVKSFFTVFLCAAFSIGCNRQAAVRETAREPEYRKITAEEAHEMMLSTSNFILLDARSQPEYREKRIAGAVLMPGDEIDRRAPRELQDKNALILVYCASGGRSAAAARQLAAMGYVNVYDFGGISGWPYETVGD